MKRIVIKNPLTESGKERAYYYAVYDMARKKGMRLYAVKVHVKDGYAIAQDMSNYRYKIKLTPKGVSKSWVATNESLYKNPKREKGLFTLIVHDHNHNIRSVYIMDNESGKILKHVKTLAEAKAYARIKGLPIEINE